MPHISFMSSGCYQLSRRYILGNIVERDQDDVDVYVEGREALELRHYSTSLLIEYMCVVCDMTTVWREKFVR